ncbi:hypothetical protein B0H10DRAFT_1941199 [Mycena sp. CBHHK59/15]|nr:hypothetical protein B0H10DRAFT_1941199 [Mycena sp. CBHHK59/15]
MSKAFSRIFHNHIRIATGYLQHALQPILNTSALLGPPGGFPIPGSQYNGLSLPPFSSNKLATPSKHPPPCSPVYNIRARAGVHNPRDRTRVQHARSHSYTHPRSSCRPRSCRGPPLRRDRVRPPQFRSFLLPRSRPAVRHLGEHLSWRGELPPRPSEQQHARRVGSLPLCMVLETGYIPPSMSVFRFPIGLPEHEE